jgi:hypothetical protein
MSPISVLTSARSWLCLIAMAAVSLLATSSIDTGAAGAATGGIGTTSGTGAHGTSKRLAKYDRIWLGFSRSVRRWAHNTSECESGSNPRAIGGDGLYRGAFQFMKATWRSSPKSPGGDPISYSYRTQAVVAVMLKKRAGTSPWPVCG